MAVFLVPDSDPASDLPSSSSSSILSRLRLQTRGEHEALESVLDLMDGALTLSAYGWRLQQFYGFYAPLEAALQARCAVQLPALLPRLTKTTLLRQDLHHLGIAASKVPLCAALVPLHTQAQVLGCLYVMEGATLGGRLISQHIHAALGLTPRAGGSFFEGYGLHTGPMWRAMRQLLVSGADDVPTEDAIVASAIATFVSLRRWCEAAPFLASVQAENCAEAAHHA